jgi:GntR family transcriptional repressor for pyruvate dehydrogenase complex
MTQKTEDRLTYDTLNFLKSHGSPVGAGSVQRHLESKGHSIAEATVGRLLRELDDRGLTEKKSNRGRALSESGELYLSELKERKWQGEWTEDFIGALGNGERKHLLELLVARRPVEIEIARLAAMHATDEDIDVLEALVDRQEQNAQMARPVSTLDTEFHTALARAAKNKILEAIVALLRKKQEYASEFETIRRRAGHIYNDEHRKIFEAVQSKDPELAVLTMKRHLDNLVASVKAAKE